MTIHQTHYPDNPPVVDSDKSSGRPSDLIRERGREIIERERIRAAAAELQKAAEKDITANARVRPSPRD